MDVKNKGFLIKINQGEIGGQRFSGGSGGGSPNYISQNLRYDLYE